MINELSARIWARADFQSEYALLLQKSLSNSTKVTGVAIAPLGTDSIRRLLQCATHFAGSTERVHREAAYRIATSVWSLFGTEYRNVQDISSFVLGRLGNFPAVHYLARGDAEGEDDLPRPLWFEIRTHEDANSVNVTAKISVTLTDFQKRLWDSLASGASVAVSAPTSAGKSFALQRFLLGSLHEHSAWGLYIVPTRALINQVSDSLSELINQNGYGSLAVSTIPIPPSDLGKASGVYILTQERLHILLESGADVPFRIVVVDEAQMVGEGARGVILQTVIERLRTNAPEAQMFFGSPQTANPAIFGRLFDLPALEIVTELESPVAQNLIFLDTDPLLINQVAVSAIIGSRQERLGTIVMDQGLYDRDQTLAYLSWVFGRDEKSLVYARGQANCEDIADKLVQLAKEVETENAPPADALLQEFSAFIAEHVHPRYLLVDSVLHGVAFHYGNMPAIVRKMIEEFFEEGRLSYLVCTSTLLHGVNLPAKNLFLLDPTKGRDWGTAEDIPVSALEFWNLAGRAGRLGKDFEGNVYLIDIASWQSQPLEGDKQQSVTSALTDAITTRGEELVRFIEDRGHSSGRSQALENTFVKALNDYRKGDLQQMFNKMGLPDDSNLRIRIEGALADAAGGIDVPAWITERNINVSVFRQQEMFDYLRKRILEIGPAELIPVHPLRPWDEALKSLLRVFKRIHTRFEKKAGADRSQYFYAPLALRWMRGDPLPMLIEDAFQYKQKKRKRAIKIATVIREVMSDIEQDVRFRYVKYVSCYNDLLAEALEQTGNSELRPRIPGLPLFMELGASSRTMVNFIGIGVSRTAAGILTGKAANKEMTRPEVERWLRTQNWNTADVSNIVLRDVMRIVGRS
ncbi:MAG: DEAD/DEAH box helicase [Gemmatimonadetes bacterium]|nr:DEAD/DEAH box helicase [Gemmatimonadota bacterium]